MLEDAIVAALLVAGVGAALVGVLGTVVRQDPYDRLHFAGAANSAAVPLIGIALLVDGVAWRSVGELVLVLATAGIGGLLGSHALARAFLVRERGDWRIEQQPVSEEGGPE